MDKLPRDIILAANRMRNCRKAAAGEIPNELAKRIMKTDRLSPAVRDKVCTECGAPGREHISANARATWGSRSITNHPGH